MFERKTERAASVVLTDEQLELVVGGYNDGGDIPICPPSLPGRPWGGPGPSPLVGGGGGAGKVALLFPF